VRSDIGTGWSAHSFSGTFVLGKALVERLLLAVWPAAIDGDDRASQRALRIVQEIGRTSGVSRPMGVEASHPRPAIEPRRVFGGMSDAEWLRRYSIAWEEVLASRPVGPLVEDDS